CIYVLQTNGYGQDNVGETPDSTEASRQYQNFQQNAWFYSSSFGQSNSGTETKLDSMDYLGMPQQFSEFFNPQYSSSSEFQSSNTTCYLQQVQERVSNSMPFSTSTPHQGGMNGTETDSSSCEPTLTASSSNTSNQTDKSSLMLTNSPGKDEVGASIKGSNSNYLGREFYFQSSGYNYAHRVDGTETNSPSGATIHYYDSNSMPAYQSRYGLDDEGKKDFFQGIYTNDQSSAYAIENSERIYGALDRFSYYQNSLETQEISPRASDLETALYNPKRLTSGENYPQKGSVYSTKFDNYEVFDGVSLPEASKFPFQGFQLSSEETMDAATSLMLGSLTSSLSSTAPIVQSRSSSYMARSSVCSEEAASPSEALHTGDNNTESNANSDSGQYRIERGRDMF
ncbi:hypothetical protein Ciccas_010239, partial [Cichlidogyrus casuarinus]